jgi:RHS repeat-associated protein
LNVRATEYTVGPNGPQAMPGDLPPVSGYYDRQKAAWIASENGRVVKIVDIVGGAANLDTDGDGVIDNGDVVTATMDLTITLAERQNLATLYQAGQTLWRVPIPHFTPWNFNWPYGAPDDASTPNVSMPASPQPEDGSDLQCHSIVECQNQNLREVIDVAGTPFQLAYQSERAAGRRTAYQLDITLSNNDLPASVKGIELEISLAGRRFTKSFPAAPNQRTSFSWDGKDAHGQTLLGPQAVTVRVGYAFTAIYRTPAENAVAFAAYGSAISGVRARQQVILWQEWQGQLGAWQARAQGLGGWTLSVQHAYDPIGKTLYLGNGDRRSAASLNQDIIKTVAGTGQPGQPGLSGDGNLATTAQLWTPQGVAVGPDGNLYVADLGNNRIRRINASGVITTVAGGGNFTPNLGDGGPATQALLASPQDVVVAPDGSFYVSTTGNGGVHDHIRKIDPNGVISTLVGTGVPGFSGDGGPAALAQINHPRGLALSTDGSLYFVDWFNNRVRRISPDGIITTVAGGGSCATSSCGDGGPAAQARLNQPQRVALGPDGSLYVSEIDRVRRVGPDGIITTYAGPGTCVSTPACGDGGPATQAKLGNVDGLVVASDGALYIATNNSNTFYIRRVGTNGIITTIAGNGSCPAISNCYQGEGGPALRARIHPRGLAFGADGSLYVADQYNDAVRRIAPSLPGIKVGEIVIPSEDGSRLYVFGSNGVHQVTLNALTHAVLYDFAYDGNGRLQAIIDANVSTTTIERDANGNPTAIVGPFGQRTTLTLDANGYLSTVTNPAYETVQLQHTPTGLLTKVTWPRGNSNTFTYDNDGRLIKDSDSANGSLTLARTDSGTGYAVNVTTALSRTTTYQVTRTVTGTQTRTNVLPGGLTNETVSNADGTYSSRALDGTRITTTLGPDPRWGMLSPLTANAQLQTPDGLSLTMASTRTATLSNPGDPFSLVALTDTLKMNNRTYTGTYNTTSRAWTLITPAGRQSTLMLDDQGRLVQQQAPGLAPLRYDYDNRGRLICVTQGISPTVRVSAFAYGTDGFTSAITDAAGRQATLARDAADRVITHTLANNTQILYVYDLNSQLSGLQPPDRPAQTLMYTPIDLVASYSAATTPTQYAYDPDRQISTITRPDGAVIQAGYDAVGQLNSLTTPRGQTVYTYSQTTGQLIAIGAPQNIGLAYTYNGFLLKSEAWSGPIAATITRTYNADLRLGMLGIAGVPIGYQYDPDGLLIQAGNWQLTNNPQNGLFVGSTLGGVTDTQQSNVFGEATVYEAAYNGAAQYRAEYGRDELGRITTLTETIGGVTTVWAYDYDLVGRLTHVRQNGVLTGTFTYDNNSNRLSNGATLGTYDTQDRLLYYGTTTYSYTLAGDLKLKVTGNQTTTYQYDALGNLVATGLPNGNALTYLIDGANRRIGKRVNGTLVQGWVYQDSGRLAAELDGGGNVVSRFVYGANTAPAYMLKGGATYRLVTDQVGSLRLVIDVATGQIAQRLDYDAFGNVTLDTNPGFQPFGFAGGLYDRDTQLVRFGARDYDAATGRWTVKDPIGLGGGQTNLYTYVNNDPINHLDPSGLEEAVAGEEEDTTPTWRDRAGGLIDLAMEQFKSMASKVLCFGAACLSTDKPEIKVGGNVGFEVNGTPVASLSGECAGGITTEGTASDPLFTFRAKLGASIPSLAKIPVIGKYFKEEFKVEKDFGQVEHYGGRDMQLNQADAVFNGTYGPPR